MGKFINPFTDVGFKRIFGQEFSKLAEVGDVSALTKDERIKYDYALKKFRDTYNTIRGAEQKGRAEGRAEVVKAMRSKGYTDEDIILITGISPEELEKI